MTQQARRLRTVVLRLPPRQAVVRWMEEAHRSPSFPAFVAAGVARIEQGLPLATVPNAVAAGVRQAMRGSPPEEVRKAQRQARKEVHFLLHLHADLNLRINHQAQAWQRSTLLALEQTRHCLQAQAAAERLLDLRLGLWQQPYPLDERTAAAVSAALEHAVQTWDRLFDGGTVSEWVKRSFVEEGHEQLPEGAALYQFDPNGTRWPLFARPEAEELRPHFASEADWQAFCAGTDFTSGLADVPNAVFHERVEAVTAAMHDLVATGAVAAGRELRLTDDPFRFLDAVPLLDGVWLDREILARAEAAVELEKRGYSRVTADDDHPLAVPAWEPPAGKPDAAAAILIGVRERLAAYPGRVQLLDARPYLHLDEYRRWRGRRLKDLPEPEDGIVIASWNAWIDAQGDAGEARLAGVQVDSLSSWVAGCTWTVHAADEVTALQAQRRKLLRTLGPDDEEDGDDGERHRRLEQACRLRENLDNHLRDLWATRDAITALSRHYFGGAELLYDEERAVLVTSITQTEDLVATFNRFIAPILDAAMARGGDKGTASQLGARLDHNELQRNTEAQRELMLRFHTDHARAITLDDLGSSREGQLLMARYLSHGAEPKE